MSRNRESWLLSQALPHIPFLLLVKSFPFTFPPSLCFGGEKTQAPASAECSKPPACDSAEPRYRWRLRDAEPRCSRSPQQRLAFPVLSCEWHRACEQPVLPSTFHAKHSSSPRLPQRAAGQRLS